MSTSGLTNDYNPPTLDGLTVIDANEIYIDGQLVDLTNLVPYTGADKPVDVGAQPIRTTYAPVAANDVVNLDTLTNAVTFIDNSVALTYLNKITSSSQTVAGPVTFTNGLQTSANKDVSLASTLIIDPNYQSATVSDGAVTAGSLFGTITNSGGVYQSTSSGDGGVLVLASGLSTGRVRLVINLLVNDSNPVAVSLAGSADGVNPYQSIASNTFPAGTTTFWTSDTTFSLSYPYIILTCNTVAPGVGATVQWYGLVLYQMGVALNHVSMPSLTADRVAVLNERKQLVSSGISVTKLDYLDNVSSDIQTQLNGKLNLSGSNANQNIVLGAYKVQSSATPSTGNDYINKTYGDATYATTAVLSGYVLKAGDTLTGTLYNSAGDFHAYKGGDTNRGCVLFANNQDGATFSTYNGGLASWNGIGFNCTLDSITRFIYDTRTGNSEQTGKHTCTGLNVNVSGASAATTAFHVYTTTANHYDENPSTTYLISGLSGYITLANKTTRNDTDACMMLGTNSDLSEVTSVTTDGSGLMPLNFGGSSFLFTGGQVTVNNTTQLRNTFIRSGYILTCNNGSNATEEADRTQIAFAWNGSTNQYRHRITSEHNGIDGTTANGNSLNFYLWSSADGADDLGTNHIMSLAGRGLGVRVVNPEGDLHVKLSGAVNDYWGRLLVKTTSFWGDGCSSRSETAGTQYATMFPMMFLAPHIVSDDDGWCVIRMGRSGGVSSGRWWEIANRADGSFQIGVERSGQFVINPSGNVGIGGIDATRKLNVEGNARVSGNLTVGGNGSYVGLLDVGGGLIRIDGNASSSTVGSIYTYNRPLVLNPTGTYVNMYVGIGTTSPQHKLHVDGGIMSDDWFRLSNNNNGLYWQNLGWGICSNVGAGNTYGNISTYGPGGAGGWQGYGLRDRYCLMAYSYASDWGIHDNVYSWLIRGDGQSARSCWIGGGVAQFSRNWDRCLMFANGDNTSGGYFYYNQGNAYGTISDRRIKKDFQGILSDQSVSFLKALEPTSFCLKESTCGKTKLADGTEVEECGSGVCSCRQDGWVAQNVLDACAKSGASKSVINNWYDYEQELGKPEEERKTLIGVSDRPILSHTVNVVKALMEQVETLQQRNAILEAAARQQEAKQKEQEERLRKAEERMEKMASLLSQLITSK